MIGPVLTDFFRRIVFGAGEDPCAECVDLFCFQGRLSHRHSRLRRAPVI